MNLSNSVYLSYNNSVIKINSCELPSFSSKSLNLFKKYASSKLFSSLVEVNLTKKITSLCELHENSKLENIHFHYGKAFLKSLIFTALAATGILGTIFIASQSPSLAFLFGLASFLLCTELAYQNVGHLVPKEYYFFSLFIAPIAPLIQEYNKKNFLLNELQQKSSKTAKIFEDYSRFFTHQGNVNSLLSKFENKINAYQATLLFHPDLEDNKKVEAKLLASQQVLKELQQAKKYFKQIATKKSNEDLYLSGDLQATLHLSTSQMEANKAPKKAFKGLSRIFTRD